LNSFLKYAIVIYWISFELFLIYKDSIIKDSIIFSFVDQEFLDF